MNFSPFSVLEISVSYYYAKGNISAEAEAALAASPPQSAHLSVLNSFGHLSSIIIPCLKPNQHMCLFSTSKGIMVGRQPRQEISRFPKLTSSVNQPVVIVQLSWIDGDKYQSKYPKQMWVGGLFLTNY